MRGDPPPRCTWSVHSRQSTPHARGSTPVCRYDIYRAIVYPACAGIHPLQKHTLIKQSGLPRMRGDPPLGAYLPGRLKQSTPHARGSTPFSDQISLKPEVYPACAGIHPSFKNDNLNLFRLPRMRGDPPARVIAPLVVRESTPHARGSTWCDYSYNFIVTVYPACAGIHPT